MTIWLYCLFGHEQKLMPYFLRHYASQVDRLVMLDGGSDDATRAIIRACPNAAIQDSPFTNDRYDEVEWVSWMSIKYHEARFSADWVLVVDTDEFLYTDGLPLRTALEDYRRHFGIRAIQSDGWQMLADEFPPDHGMQLTDLVTEGVRDKIYDKIAAFDPNLDVAWSVGRHSAAVTGANAERAGLKLLHYRYFGEAYMRERNAINYARRSKEDIRYNRGYHGAPDYVEGRYSINWYKFMMSQSERVTNGELLYTR